VARPLETRNKGSENASPRFSERDTPFLGRTTGHATGTCVRPSLPTTAVGLNPGEFTWLAGRSGVCEWRFVDLCSRADMKTPCKARITTEYRVEYESPIEVAAGERVRLGREDSEFLGWKWCEALDGHAGWVPGRVPLGGRRGSNSSAGLLGAGAGSSAGRGSHGRRCPARVAAGSQCPRRTRLDSGVPCAGALDHLSTGDNGPR
jgi:hypothetical protein